VDQTVVRRGVTIGWKRLLPARGFVALPRRCVVERMFAWLSHNYRMSKDYERLGATGEAFVYAADNKADSGAVSLCLGLFTQSL